MENYNYKQTIPVTTECDVLVVGGGTAGFPAAISAARTGARTILVERFGFLGGCFIGGAIGFHTFYNVYHRDPHAQKEKLVAGIPQEIVDRVTAMGGGMGHLEFTKSELTSVLTPIEPEHFKLLAHEMAQEAGVQLLLHTAAIGALTEDSRIRGVVIHNKAGLQAILAKQVIDCTGDGDIAADAGVPFKNYTKDDGLNTFGRGISLTLRIANVNLEETVAWLEGSAAIRSIVWGAKQGGSGRDLIRAGLNFREVMPEKVKEYGIGGGLITTSIMQHDLTYCNCTWHIPTDNLDAKDLTNSELVLRRQAAKVIRFLRENIVGFENAYLALTSYQLGVRLSRIFDCEYELSREEVLDGTKFDDQIGKLSFVDIPDQFIKDSGWVGVPYRIFIPKAVENLLLGGRMVSHDHLVHQTTRNTVAGMIGGQAVGTAAALSFAAGISPRQLDPQTLRQKLRADGVLLD